MEASNELGFATLEVSDAPTSLPIPIFGDAAGELAGTRCNPMHALIGVVGGDIRYRGDGVDASTLSGTLVKAGEELDWTDAGHSYQSFIERGSFIAVNGATSVTLFISWRS